MKLGQQMEIEFSYEIFSQSIYSDKFFEFLAQNRYFFFCLIIIKLTSSVKDFEGLKQPVINSHFSNVGV